jgi:hypothetical protein
MSWEVIESTDGYHVHVVPSDEDGIPLPPHTESTHCICHPEIELEGNKTLVIHNQLN